MEWPSDSIEPRWGTSSRQKWKLLCHSSPHPCRLLLIPPSPRPTPETETTIEPPNPQNAKLIHCPTSFRPQTDSSPQEETSNSEDDRSNDEDSQDFRNSNTIPSKQLKNRRNRYHETTVPTKIKLNITTEYKLRENSAS